MADNSQASLPALRQAWGAADGVRGPPELPAPALAGLLHGAPGAGTHPLALANQLPAVLWLLALPTARPSHTRHCLTALSLLESHLLCNFPDQTITIYLCMYSH